MLSRLILSAVLCCSLHLTMAQNSVQDFRLGGSAFILTDECIRLTPDYPYVSGSAWFKRPIDLNLPFEMQVSIVLGEKDQEGADGIVFVFHPSMQTGYRGEGMGFAGLVPSLGLEFDTYQNYHLNDPEKDHLALMTNGRAYHRTGIARLSQLPNLEDGKRHPLYITWNPEATELKVYLDRELVGNYKTDLINGVFGGNPMVYWGVTAATGRLNNYQDVCIEKLIFAYLEK